MKKCHAYYLVSTPLHLLVSLAVALSRRQEESAKLFFVAQESDNQRMDFFRDSMQNWQESPFIEAKFFFRPVGKFWGKVSQRKQLFEQLEQEAGTFLPERIYVGNDRHLEFQWLMHYCQMKGVSAKGIYIDEGLYTYVGRKASKRFSDRVIDNSLKKLFYGNWWQTPPTIGGSKWIEEIIVAYPELVCPLLRNKAIRLLEQAWFESPSLSAITQAWLQDFEVNQHQLKDCHLVLTLPEKNDMLQVAGYADDAIQLVKTLSDKGWLVGVKYHPKDMGKDVLQVLAFEGVFEVPANMPFEVVLPSLTRGCYVLGDMSTTVLMSKLFRQDLCVMVMKLGSDSFHFNQFVGFYEQLGLQPKNIAELLNVLNKNSAL